jgi:hypothetical protein
VQTALSSISNLQRAPRRVGERGPLQAASSSQGCHKLLERHLLGSFHSSLHPSATQQQVSQAGLHKQKPPTAPLHTHTHRQLATEYSLTTITKLPPPPTHWFKPPGTNWMSCIQSVRTLYLHYITSHWHIMQASQQFVRPCTHGHQPSQVQHSLSGIG